ncbi:MAG: RdgB/HAM1 family non-canonical purine NTP pyrophosphatase [Angelakisella sp.]|nr:RdgB/HAM1 family non-canonical purine NTP pyrophosphatase [Angelakisella sp.]
MKIIVATRNKGKLVEFERILSPMGFEVVGQEEICPGIEVEEDGETFAENAYKKAHSIFLLTGLPTIADDSGLCVDALNGEPGVYSARYAGEPHSDQACNRKLLHNLQDVPVHKRTAQFISAICCVFAEDDMVSCEGSCEGIIGFEPVGDGGFGYDPLFLVGEKSFSQLSGEEKDAVSHRGKALRVFAQLMKRRTNCC